MELEPGDEVDLLYDGQVRIRVLEDDSDGRRHDGDEADAY